MDGITHHELLKQNHSVTEDLVFAFGDTSSLLQTGKGPRYNSPVPLIHPSLHIQVVNKVYTFSHLSSSSFSSRAYSSSSIFVFSSNLLKFLISSSLIRPVTRKGKAPPMASYRLLSLSQVSFLFTLF
jgi:hypothetical protein